MDIKTFATSHRLKVIRDGEGEDIEYVVPGRIGQSQIYQHSEDLLGVLFMTDARKPPRTGLFNTFRDACLAVGMTAHQIGDAEGSFLFKGRDREQPEVAIRGIRAKAKRRISPEQALAGAARLQAARLSRQKVENPKQEALI